MLEQLYLYNTKTLKQLQEEGSWVLYNLELICNPSINEYLKVSSLYTKDCVGLAVLYTDDLYNVDKFCFIDLFYMNYIKISKDFVKKLWCYDIINAKCNCSWKLSKQEKIDLMSLLNSESEFRGRKNVRVWEQIFLCSFPYFKELAKMQIPNLLKLPD